MGFRVNTYLELLNWNIVIFLLIYALLPSCFTRSNQWFDEAHIRAVEPFHAQMIKEYFLGKGLPDAMTPNIKVLSSYEKSISNLDEFEMSVDNIKIPFQLGVRVTSFVLKPVKETELVDSMKSIFPFFKQNKLATLCLYRNYLETDHGHLAKLSMFGKPIMNQSDLQSLTETSITSELFWIIDPWEARNHIKTCREKYDNNLKDATIELLKNYGSNLQYQREKEPCLPPDSRKRLKDPKLQLSGDYSCMSWFASFSDSIKQVAIPRCVKTKGSSQNLGLCELRARANTSVPVFYNPKGGISSERNSLQTNTMTNLSQIQFYCDETIGSQLKIKKHGSWFTFYEAECVPPKLI